MYEEILSWMQCSDGRRLRNLAQEDHCGPNWSQCVRVDLVQIRLVVTFPYDGSLKGMSLTMVVVEEEASDKPQLVKHSVVDWRFC